MIHLAGLPPGSRVSREVLARAGEIPAHFLSKILQALVRAGLITSQRGVSGGFTLTRRPDEMTMLEVVEAIQGPIWLNQCVDPAQPCARQSWCAAHVVWVEAQEAVTKILGGATLTALARESTARRDQNAFPFCVLAEQGKITR